MEKKKYIIGTILLVIITNVISIGIAHDIGYDVGVKEQSSYIRKLEVKNKKMERVSRQVLKETIEAFRKESDKQLRQGNYNAYVSWQESIKVYQTALDSIDSYSLLGEFK